MTASRRLLRAILTVLPLASTVASSSRSAGAAPAAEPPDAPPPTVIVHVEAPWTVELEQRTDVDEPWRTVCLSPRDTRLAQQAEYRVVGPDLEPSAAFELQVVPGARGVSLTVHPSFSSPRGLVLGMGVVGVGGGGGLLVVGFYALAFCSVGAAGGDNGTPNSGTRDDCRGPRTVAIAGAITFAVGLVLGGIGLALPTGETRVGQDEPAKQPAPKWVPRERRGRFASWREPTPAHSPGAPAFDAVGYRLSF